MLDVDTVAYAPVGLGSRPGTASSPTGHRWFVTADAKALSGTPTFSEPDAVLRTAADLHDRGMEAVVAQPERDLWPLERDGVTDDVRQPHTDDQEIAESVDYLVRSIARLSVEGLVTRPSLPASRRRRAVEADRSRSLHTRSGIRLRPQEPAVSGFCRPRPGR